MGPLVLRASGSHAQVIDSFVKFRSGSSSDGSGSGLQFPRLLRYYGFLSPGYVPYLPKMWFVTSPLAVFVVQNRVFYDGESQNHAFCSRVEAFYMVLNPESRQTAFSLI